MELNSILRTLVVLTDPQFDVFDADDRKYHPEVKRRAIRWQNKLAKHGLCKRAFGRPILVSAAAHSRGARSSNGKIIRLQLDYKIDIGNIVFKLIPDAELMICDHADHGFRVIISMGPRGAELTYEEIEAVHEALRKSGYYLAYISSYARGLRVGLNYIASPSRWLSVFANSTRWTIHSDFRGLIRCPDVYPELNGWWRMFGDHDS